MLATGKDTSPIGVAHASFAITGIEKEFLDTIDGSDVVLDPRLCTPDLELARVDFH